MKRLSITILFLSLSFFIFSQEERHYFRGVYSGKNVYVKNPKLSNTDQFCISEVQVNGRQMYPELNSSAFSIDLSSLEMNVADSVTIEITSKDGGVPKLINPEVISPASSFKIEDILLTKDGWLQWVTINEGGNLPFVIEQFKWNKWVTIGEVMGQGGKEENKYAFQFNMHYGKNTVRVKQKDRSLEKFSKEVSNEGMRDEPVELVSSTLKAVIQFTDVTSFELYDEYGTLLLYETAESIEVSDLPKGLYYLNYANKSGVKVLKK